MKKLSESFIIFILFCVQFIDVLDFMVVMPLGPDFAESLDIPESKLGKIAGSYTFAAAFTGILTSAFIDRFDRKKVLLLTLFGLLFSNILSAKATNYEILLVSRFLAGAFGGPATSVCFAIVADLFPVNRRGVAMGRVMTGFSLAAIFGVPLGLKVALMYGWYASFYMVSLLALLTIILVWVFMPSVASHLKEDGVKKNTYLSLLSNRTYLIAFITVALGSIASFMIIPYISPFLQLNLKFPRDDIGIIYFVGGIGSFIAMNLVGKIIDKYSSSLAAWVSNIFIGFTLIFCFVNNLSSVPVIVTCTPFMIGMAIRNVSTFTLYSKIPSNSDRAGFMSVLSCVQHIASFIGATGASIIILQKDNYLINIDIVVYISLFLFLIAPFLMQKIEKNLKKQ